MKVFSSSHYFQESLRRAEYHQDENRMVIAKVPGASGFFAQGDSFEEARENLRDAHSTSFVEALIKNNAFNK